MASSRQGTANASTASTSALPSSLKQLRCVMAEKRQRLKKRKIFQNSPDVEEYCCDLSPEFFSCERFCGVSPEIFGCEGFFTEDFKKSWQGQSRPYPLPIDASSEHHEDFDKLFPVYMRQATQSEGFDIDDYPGHVVGAIAPYWLFKHERIAEKMMELAKWAIREYNEKSCNEFKYRVLKIEKENLLFGNFYEYFMTVKVLNITLGTPIETFQIGAAASPFNDDKRIFLCRPKEEGAMATIKASGGWFAKSNGLKCLCRDKMRFNYF